MKAGATSLRKPILSPEQTPLKLLNAGKPNWKGENRKPGRVNNLDCAFVNLLEMSYSDTSLLLIPVLAHSYLFTSVFEQ